MALCHFVSFQARPPGQLCREYLIFGQDSVFILSKRGVIMISKNACFGLLLLLSGISGLEVYGQMATGNIGGQVLDSSGGVVPNAKVVILHSATGQSRVHTTNERGEFLAPLMPIGEYEV